MDWLSRGANLPQIGLNARFRWLPKSNRLGLESVIGFVRNTQSDFSARDSAMDIKYVLYSVRPV